MTGQDGYTRGGIGYTRRDITCKPEEVPPVERQQGGGSSQTASLLRAYHRAGDAAARERLVEVYLPLVRSFARRYSRSSDDYEDLYQVGCIGLINAIDRFDVSRGGELAAFAVPTIAGEIRRYLRDRGGSVKLPRRVLELRTPALRAQRELSAALGRAPTSAEVAAELGAREEDVALALDAGRASQAYELSVESPGETDPLDAVEDRVFLSEAFRGLDQADRRILYLRFVRDLEPGEVARELGLSQRQLSRRTEAALAKLREQLEEESHPAGERGNSAPAKERRPRRNRRQAGSPAENSYRIEVARQAGPEGGWAATVAELPGCVAWGATQVEAVSAIDAAISAWIAEATASGREIPRPRAASSHSGRLLVRMPQSLHADLSRAAEREEVSLNQFITSVLASAVGWRVGDEPEQREPRADDSARRRALSLNLVVLAVVGLIALALLVVELVQRI